MCPILKVSLCFTMVTLLGGCSFPELRHCYRHHDFSVLEKDVFSNFIREVYSRHLDGVIQIKFHRDTGPFTRTIVTREYMSDESHHLNLTVRSRNFWMGKSRVQVEEVFTQAGGRCLPPKKGLTEKHIYCTVIRQWRYSGLRTDGKKWPNPTRQLAHLFALSKEDQVIGLNLKFIDLTAYPKHNLSPCKY